MLCNWMWGFWAILSIPKQSQEGNFDYAKFALERFNLYEEHKKKYLENNK